MKRNGKSDAILWVEAVGFSLLILLCWVTEWVRIPHVLFGEDFVPDWRRALLRSVVIACVWVAVHVATKRLLKRLHHLEEFLRICGWCRKVCHDGEWLPLERYFSSKFATQTTHGMCPDCLQKHVEELRQRKNSNSDPNQ